MSSVRKATPAKQRSRRTLQKGRARKNLAMKPIGLIEFQKNWPRFRKLLEDDARARRIKAILAVDRTKCMMSVENWK